MIYQLLAFVVFPFIVIDDSILALGDSYTIGEGVEVQERWPMQLAKLLNDKGRTASLPKIIAKTGWTTDELQSGIDQEELAESYDWVTLLIGVNNQYRERDIEEYRTQFRELLELAIKKTGGDPSRVIVLSIPDWGVTPFAVKRKRDPELIAKQIDQFNEVNREETTKRKAIYIDITKLTRDAASNPSKYLVADELHPSAEMYAQWAEMASRVILSRRE